MIAGNITNQFNCPLDCICDGNLQPGMSLFEFDLVAIDPLGDLVEVNLFNSACIDLVPLGLDIINFVGGQDLVDLGVWQAGVQANLPGSQVIINILPVGFNIQIIVPTLITEDCCGDGFDVIPLSVNTIANVITPFLQCCLVQNPNPTVSITNLVTGANLVVPVAPNGDYLIPDPPLNGINGVSNFSGDPVLIQVLDCNNVVLFTNQFTFPYTANGNPRNWMGLDIQVFDPDSEDCNPIPLVDVPETFCNFYIVRDLCTNTVCVYNTQASMYNRISYDFGDGTGEQFTDDNICHTYINFGNYQIVQRVYLIDLQVQPNCCGAGIIIEAIIAQCEQEQDLVIIRTKPTTSFTLNNPIECCEEDCTEGRNVCLNLNTTLEIVPNVIFNDQDCCVDDVDPGVVGGDCPPPILVQECIRSLDIDNYVFTAVPPPANALNPLGIVQPNPLLPVPNIVLIVDPILLPFAGTYDIPEPNINNPVGPEFVRIPRRVNGQFVPQYNVGTTPFSFEFWIDPKRGPNEIMDVFAGQVAGQFGPINALTTGDGRMIFRWESRNQVQNNANTALNLLPTADNYVTTVVNGVDLETEVSASIDWYTNAITFSMSRRFPIMLSQSFSSIGLIAGQLNHVVLKKTNVANPAGQLTWEGFEIWVNGVQCNVPVTHRVVYDGNLPAVVYSGVLNAQQNLLFVESNLDFADGDLTIGAEFNAGSQFQLNNASVRANAGHMVIHNFRMYNREMIPLEIQNNFEGGCDSDPSNLQGLVIDYKFNNDFGEVVNPEMVWSGQAILENYVDALRTDQGAPNLAWVNNLCCNDPQLIPIVPGMDPEDIFNFTVTRPDGIIEDDLIFDNGRLLYNFNRTGLYKLLLRICNCCGCCTYEENLQIGPKVYVQRLDCLQYKLVDRNVYLTPVELTITLLNLKNEVILLYNEDNYAGNQAYNISIPNDGIYILDYAIFSVNPNTNVRTMADKKRFTLYDFCTLLTCYRNLMMDINCKECGDCTPDNHEYNQRMFKVNQFTANVMAFLANVTTHFGASNGALTFQDKYLGLLKDTDFYLENLLKFCSNCNYQSSKFDIPVTCIKKSIPGCC